MVREKGYVKGTVTAYSPVLPICKVGTVKAVVFGRIVQVVGGC